MRRLKQLLILCGGLFSLIGHAKELPLETCDVLVVGGGSAGICAAVQSARAGAKTVLVEMAHAVGGATTTGGVNFPGLFHAWGRQVIDGIGWSLVTNTVALAGGRLPDFTQPTGRNHPKHQVIVNIPLFVALSEEALLQSGVTIHYHEAPLRVTASAGGWQVQTAVMGDTRMIQCKQLVDCTGNGAVVDLAGCERQRGEERQPGSFCYQLKLNTDLAKIDRKDLERRFNDAVASGRVERADARWGIYHHLQVGGNVGNYVMGADNSTGDLRTETNLRGRASMLRLYRFLKSVPGLEKVSLETMAPEVGIRETYRIVGEYAFTRDDYCSGRVWEDSLCYAFYPIDLHDAKSGIAPAHLKEGIVATVPLRALIPKGSSRLIVAGRCVSSDRLANSALRVQASCMAMGQVAGAVAAVAAKEDVTPLKVSLPAVRAVLRQHGAIIP
jgi:hypothetical protein